ISNNNIKGEYYLTDIIPIAANLGKKIIGVETPDPDEVMGINTVNELEHAENIYNNRLKDREITILENVNKENQSPEIKVKRLQGTDGIRGEIALSSDPRVKGLSPLQAFLDRRLITEKFFELYAYCATLDLINLKPVKAKPQIVLGWDPRDPDGIFINAVKCGIKKAGADVLSIGIMPTPSVPLYMTYVDADGGLMITASHNPKDQNGIKIFYSYRCLKPLPKDDIRISTLIYKNSNLPLDSMQDVGKEIDCTKEATNVFKNFTLDPRNTWIKEGDHFKKVILIVDPANGCYSNLAASLFSEFGFQKIIEINNDIKNGNVNENSGVANLEGYLVITHDMVFDTAPIDHNPIFSKHLSIKRIFEEGRAISDEIKKNFAEVRGAIFDADGDRFYRLDYNPFEDQIIVSSGDENAFQQVKLLIKLNSKYKKSFYYNTVESDLLVSKSLAKIGVKTDTIPVGDKWILLRAAFCNLLKQLDNLKNEVFYNSMISQFVTIEEEILTLMKKGIGSIKSIYDFDQKINDLISSKLLFTEQKNKASHNLFFSVGAEETGHNITEGFIKTRKGIEETIFAGNGIKSAINTFAATRRLYTKHSSIQNLQVIKEPFQRGYKRTFYAYYTDKILLEKNSPLFNKARSEIQRVFNNYFKENQFRFEDIFYPDEPDLLYIKVFDKQNLHRCSLFLRNSGTEEKTAFYIRGDRDLKYQFDLIGNEIIIFIMINMKNNLSDYAKAERKMLELLKVESIDVDELAEFLKNNSGIPEDSINRFLDELFIENFVKKSSVLVGEKEKITLSITSLALDFLNKTS
ncbi:hypothetical protein KKB18_02560, partial [bacterium]|nr:hypothetical protein [bacterium]